MAYTSKSYKKGDGYGYRHERKFQSHRVERHTSREELDEKKKLDKDEII